MTVTYKYEVQKRTAPTVTFDTASKFRAEVNGSSNNCSSMSALEIGVQTFTIDGATAGGVGAGNPGRICAVDAGNATFIAMDSEL